VFYVYALIHTFGERCLGDAYEYHGDSVSITVSKTLHTAYVVHELSSTYRVCTLFMTIKNPSLLKVYLVPFFAMVTSSMVNAISILYALDLGADILQVNLISTVQSTMGILLVVPFGLLADRLGRKPMLIYPRAIALVGILLRVLASNPTHLIIAAFVGGFAGADFYPILVTMVTDLADSADQREAISTLYLFSGIGLLVGPLIGSVLLLMPAVSLRTLYQIQLVAEVALIAYMARILRETKRETVIASTTPTRSPVRDLLAQRSFQGLLLMGFLFYFNFSILNTYLPIYGRITLQLSDHEVSSLALFRNIAITLIRLSAATFLTRVSTRWFLLLALTGGGIASLGAPIASTYSLIATIQVISGMSHGAVAILGSQLVAAEAQAANRGVAQSINNMTHGLSNIMKLPTASLAESYGLMPVFLLGSIASFASTLPVFRRKH
jgi:MFS family permease